MIHAVAWAVTASILIGISTILLNICVKRTNPVTTMLWVTLIGTFVFAIITVINVPASYWTSRAIPYFVAAGLLSPAMVRWLNLISLKRIGVSITASILATGPAFTAMIAIVFLKEKVTVPIGLGIAAIVVGIIFFERQHNADAAIAPRRKTDLLLPLLAAMLYALAVVFRKKGLDILDSPILGVTTGFGTSVLVYMGMLLFSPKMRREISIGKSDLPYLVGTGLFLTTAWFCIFHALSKGDAVVVTPLANLHPLVVVGISKFLLKEESEVTPMIVSGVVLVVAGVALITLGKS